MNASKEGKGVNLNHVAESFSSVFHVEAAGAEELLIFLQVLVGWIRG
jgi:hypothetical protein